MGYRQLGDISQDVTDRLTLLQQAANTIQTGFNELADKLRTSGSTAVRVSNATTGAAAGAKAGATAGAELPTSVVDALAAIPAPVKYGAGLYLLYRILR